MPAWVRMPMPTSETLAMRSSPTMPCAPMAGFTFVSRISIARLNSLRCTVKEKSVMPSVEAFWMIMSTSMLASAIGPEDRERDAGPVGHAQRR